MVSKVGGGASGPFAVFPGPNDHWHRHETLVLSELLRGESREARARHDRARSGRSREDSARYASARTQWASHRRNWQRKILSTHHAATPNGQVLVG